MFLILFITFYNTFPHNKVYDLVSHCVSLFALHVQSSIIILIATLIFRLHPSAVCTLPSLTKLPQSAHYHHVVSSQWFLQNGRLGLPLNRLNERGFALTFPSCFSRDANLRTHPRANLFFFRSVHPPNLSSGEQPGRRSFYLIDLVDVSFRAIKELPYSSGRPTMFAVWSWGNDAWQFQGVSVTWCWVVPLSPRF